MTFFARGLKCGGCGAIGLATGAGVAPKSFLSLSKDASAMPPRPIAQRLKKCRRVRKGKMSVPSVTLKMFKSQTTKPKEIPSTKAQTTLLRPASVYLDCDSDFGI